MYVYELHQLFEWNERAARWNEMLIIVKQDMITPASNCLKEMTQVRAFFMILTFRAVFVPPTNHCFLPIFIKAIL